MKSSNRICVRDGANKVSYNTKQLIDALFQYNGGPEEYEDLADYLTQPITLKGVRIA